MLPTPDISFVTDNSGIDAFRFFSFAAIVIIHSFPFPGQNIELTLLNALLRFAVPFFFVSSGYFLKDLTIADGLKKIVMRLVPLFLFWTLIYIFAFHQQYRLSEPMFILRTLITGGPGFHLWFLPSLGISCAMVYLLRRFGDTAMISIAVFLYTLGLIFGPYSDLLGLPALQPSTRNGPFFAFFFVLSGYLFRKYNLSISLSAGLGITFLGLGFLLSETYLLANAATKITYYDFLIGTAPFGIGVFLCSQKIIARSIAFLGPVVLGMFCIHLLFLHELQSLNINLIWEIVGTIVLSTASAILIARIPFIKRLVS